MGQLKTLLLFTFAFAVSSSCAYAADSASPPLDSIDQRAQACTPCHGKEGRATPEGYYPRIAGKPAGYLFNQLRNFRDGRRHFPMMTYLTERQRDDYLQEIAAYFASQHPPYPPPQPPNVDGATLARGHRLATEGDPAHDIPPCSACHGTHLLGVAPAVPGLLGVSPDYLVAQLGAWRSGTRHADSPDCMAQIVKRMSQQDLAAATAWLATQPAAADSAPEQAFERPPPLPCGSIEASALPP